MLGNYRPRRQGLWGVVRSLATEVRSMWRGKGPHCLDPKVYFIPFWSWTTGETDWFHLFSEKEIATCKLVQNSKRSSPLDSATKYASWLRAFLSQLWNVMKDLFWASVGPLFMSFTAICLLLFSLAFCFGLWDNCPAFLFSTLSCRRKLLEPAQARLSSQHVIRLSISIPCNSFFSAALKLVWLCCY